MRKMLFILIFANLLFSQPPCPGCEELFNAYETGLVAGLVDETVDVYMYAVYNGERLPVGNATLFIEVYNSTGDLYSRCRIFTDEKGKAVFSISEYKDACSGQGILRGCRIGIKFCCSSSPNCLLQPCLNESITSFEDVLPCGNFQPLSWPESAYINDNGNAIFATLSPTYAEVVYVPTLLPPLFGGTAPAICLPLFIIAGMLLLGAYATGGTPFFWFDLNALRFTTGQRARVTGKGGVSVSQQSVLKHLEEIESVKKTKEKITTVVAKPVKDLGAMVGIALGSGVNKLFKPLERKLEGKTVIGKQPRFIGLVKGGKPAWVRDKLRKFEKKLAEEKEKERKLQEERAGPERIAIGAEQFGAAELASAFLKSKIQVGPATGLVHFLGLSEAFVTGVATGFKGELGRKNIDEQLKLLEEKKDVVMALVSNKNVEITENGNIKVKDSDNKEIIVKNEDAARIYANLSDLYSAMSSVESNQPVAPYYLNQAEAFGFVSYLLEHYPEVSKMEGGKEFIEKIINQTNEGFSVIRNFEQYKDNPEGTIALSKLKTISDLSIIWNGNIEVVTGTTEEGKAKVETISLHMNEKELREAREKIVSLYGKDWSELMSQTEVERSLYNAFITEWNGKMPNEKQFEGWKKEQIELYEKAADKAKEIADLLEKGASQEEIEGALMEAPETAYIIVGSINPLLRGGVLTQAQMFFAQEIAGIEVGKKPEDLTKDEIFSLQGAMPRASEVFEKARAGDEEASKKIEPYLAKSFALAIVDPITGLDQTDFNNAQSTLLNKTKTTSSKAEYKGLRYSLLVGCWATLSIAHQAGVIEGILK